MIRNVLPQAKARGLNVWRRFQVFNVIVFLTLVCSISGFYWNFQFIGNTDIGTGKSILKLQLPSPSAETNASKLVLLWTPIYGKRSLEAWGVHLDILRSRCPHKCHFSVNESHLPLSDAVVYHGFPEGGSEIMYRLPNRADRTRNQVWVYFMLEPPTKHLDAYNNLSDHYDFNWTMTYRRDSDLPIYYGDFEMIPTDNVAVARAIDTSAIRSKSLVAGMMSQCNRQSGRDAYVAELKKYIPVDIYGKCGDKNCSYEEDCYEKLSKKYKFWLSFENSICPDYLTEKFFRPLMYGMVPVYLGYPNNLRHAPPGSYIHTKDFKSPEELSKYLTYLDNNLEEYLKFFDWKKQYRVRNDWVVSRWCPLCTKLQTIPRSANNERKSYKSIANWLLRNNSVNLVCLDPKPNLTAPS